MVTTTAMIIIVACGVGFAMLYTYFIKSVLGGFVRQLSEKGADSESTALALCELGLGKFAQKAAYAFLGENSTLRRFVGVTNKHHDSIDKQKYYLIAEKKQDALNRYKDNGQSPRSLVYSIIAITIAAILFILAAPYVESFIDGIPDSFKTDKVEIQGTVDDGIEYITPEEIQERYEKELEKQKAEAEKNAQLKEAEESDTDTNENSTDTDTQE